MGRTLAIILGLVVIVGGGYYAWSSGLLGEAADEASDAASSVGDAASDAVEGAADAVGDAVEGATDAASDVVEGATDAAEGAVDAATDAVEGAADAATDAVEGAADAATDTASDLVEGASDAVGGLLEGLPGAGELSNLLTPENFDADSILGLLEGVELPAGIGDQITAAIESTRDNPDLIAGVIEQVRGLLGL